MSLQKKPREELLNEIDSCAQAWRVVSVSGKTLALTEDLALVTMLIDAPAYGRTENLYLREKP